MKNIKLHTLILLAALFTAISGASLFFGYSAYTSSKALEKNYRQTLGRLEQEIARLSAQLATIQVQNQAEENSTPTISKTGNAAAAKTKKDSLVSQNEALRRLKKL